eukprot:1242419-Rhodomonas_salina.5
MQLGARGRIATLAARQVRGPRGDHVLRLRVPASSLVLVRVLVSVADAALTAIGACSPSRPACPRCSMSRCPELPSSCSARAMQR